MPEPIIGSHTHNVGAGFSALGERLVLFRIGAAGDENPPVYGFQPDQAREVAERLLHMADEAEALDTSQN